jgi:hypothetical protein
MDDYQGHRVSDFVLLEGLNRKFCAQKGSTNTSRLSVEPQNYLRAKFLIASEE